MRLSIYGRGGCCFGLERKFSAANAGARVSSWGSVFNGNRWKGAHPDFKNDHCGVDWGCASGCDADKSHWKSWFHVPIRMVAQIGQTFYVGSSWPFLDPPWSHLLDKNDCCRCWRPRDFRTLCNGESGLIFGSESWLWGVPPVSLPTPRSGTSIPSHLNQTPVE